MTVGPDVPLSGGPTIHSLSAPGTSAPSAAHPTVDSPLWGAAVVTPSDSTVLTVGRVLSVLCTVAGNITINFADGSSFAFPVTVGWSLFPFGISKLMATGTTAVATYATLI